jgi:hypothetical protein
MVRIAAGLIGTYFVAFAATSFVVAGDQGLDLRQDHPRAVAAAKSDRLDAGGEIRQPRRVAEVELIGADNVLVILRDREGHEVYRVDAATNMTIAARDVTLPHLRLHAELQEDDAPASEKPLRRAPAAPEADGLDEEAGEEQIFACESGLSALADRRAASLPRVCLSDALNGRQQYAAAAHSH